MIGYKFQYKNDIIFSMSEKFDEVCIAEHKHNILNYMCTLNNISIQINNLMFSLNKIRLMRTVSTISCIKELRKIRDQFETTSDKFYELFDKFKSLRDKTINALYEDELLDNYYDEELIRSDVEKPVFCDLDFIDYFNSYNHIDEIIDWSNSLIYCINKAQKNDEECDEECGEKCDEKCGEKCGEKCDEESDEEKNRLKAFAEDKDKLYMNLVDEFYDLNKKLSSINRRYRNIVHQLKRLQDEMPK